jgi:hypothetical protein
MQGTETFIKRILQYESYKSGLGQPLQSYRNANTHKAIPALPPHLATQLPPEAPMSLPLTSLISSLAHIINALKSHTLPNPELAIPSSQNRSLRQSPKPFFFSPRRVILVLSIISFCKSMISTLYSVRSLTNTL